jgi:hypothetical protein
VKVQYFFEPNSHKHLQVQPVIPSFFRLKNRNHSRVFLLSKGNNEEDQTLFGSRKTKGTSLERKRKRKKKKIKKDLKEVRRMI